MAVRKSPDKTGWTVRRQVQKNFVNKSDALKYHALVDSALADAWRRFQENIEPYCSIRSKLDEFLRNTRAGLGRRPAGYQTRERHRRRLLIFAAAFQNKPLDAITRKMVEGWIDKRLDEGVSADTINADLISLRAFARWARKKGYAPQILPLLDVERLHVVGKLPGKNVKPPRAHEMGDLLRTLRKIKKDRHDIGLFLIGMTLFGLRPANVWNLRRENAKRPRAGEQGLLHVKGLKGTPDRNLPIPAGTLRAAWLRDCLALGKSCGANGPRSALVPNLAGKSSRNPGGWTTGALDMALGRLAKRLKLRFTPYVIRHSCMTYLQRQGGLGPGDLRDYAGHTRIETQNIYNHGQEAETAYQTVEMALRAHNWN